MAGTTKTMETMLATENQQEATEVMAFLGELAPEEKKDFLINYINKENNITIFIIYLIINFRYKHGYFTYILFNTMTNYHLIYSVFGK